VADQGSGERGRFGRLAARIAGVFAFRYACFAVMLALSLWAELRPAPHLPDWIIDRVPYVKAVHDWNYVIWLAAYIPVGLWLLGRDADRFCRYMVTSGILSLVRGLCIAATGIGPVAGADVNPQRLAAPGVFWRAFWDILDPVGVFGRDAANVYLTKDLFFSGHVGTTFLLLLYVWPYPRLRRVMVVGHLVVLVTVFVAHMHYTIDVVGGYAVALSLFALREGDLRLAPSDHARRL